MADNFIHGRATVTRDGQNIIVDNDAKLKIGGVINQTKMIGGKAYASQDTILSELEVKIPHTGDVDLTVEQARSGVEIQFQSDNGATYVIASTNQTGEVDTGEEGLVTLTYMGDPAVKV